MSPKKKALPCPLPEGWILTDTEKRKWRLGKIIGKGGFGLIYLGNLMPVIPLNDKLPRCMVLVTLNILSKRHSLMYLFCVVVTTDRQTSSQCVSFIS